MDRAFSDLYKSTNVGILNDIRVELRSMQLHTLGDNKICEIRKKRIDADDNDRIPRRFSSDVRRNARKKLPR